MGGWVSEVAQVAVMLRAPASVVLLLVGALPVAAVGGGTAALLGPSTVDLSSSAASGAGCAWTMSSSPSAANDTHPPLVNISATVPGDLTDDLVAAGVLADPWAAAADPVESMTWAWQRRWTFRCAFRFASILRDTK